MLSKCRVVVVLPDSRHFPHQLVSNTRVIPFLTGLDLFIVILR